MERGAHTVSSIGAAVVTAPQVFKAAGVCDVVEARRALSRRVGRFDGDRECRGVAVCSELATAGCAGAELTAAETRRRLREGEFEACGCIKKIPNYESRLLS